MEYIKADTSHIRAIAGLALKLWSDNNLDDLILDFTEVIQNKNNAVFMCFDKSIEVGFAQVSLRNDYVEGTTIRPVGYIEGVYVNEQYRKIGIARKLINMGEMWAKEKGCSQMASNCELNNTNSLQFHLSCGFSEANRIICFVKEIGQPGRPQ